MEGDDPNFYPKSEDDSTQEKTSNSNKNKDNNTYKDSEYQVNKFEDLPNDLQKILIDLEKNFNVIEIKENWLFFNARKFAKLCQNILTHYNLDSYKRKFIEEYLFRVRTTKGIPLNRVYNSFRYYSPVETKKTPLSSGNKEKKKKQSRRDQGDSSLPPPSSEGKKMPSKDALQDIRYIHPREAKEQMRKGFADFGVWISTNKLDHVHTWNGKYDLSQEEEKNVWERIEQELNVTYNNTGWAYPIGEDDRFIIKVHMHKNETREIGSLRIFLERYFDHITIFQENFFRLFGFLSKEELKILMDEIKNEHTNNPLFYVELANAMGPRKTVDEFFKKGHIKCYMHNGYGKHTYIEVEVDYSLNQPELEIKGEFYPSLHLRDGIVESNKYVDSVLFMDSNNKKNFKQQNRTLDLLNSTVYSTGQQVQVLSNQIEYQYTDFLGELSKLGIEQELQYLDLKELSTQKVKILKNITYYLSLLDQSLEQQYITSREESKKETDLILASISDMKKDLKKEFDNLKNIVLEKIESSHKEFKNNLYLVLRSIKQLPGVTSKELVDLLKQELNVSQTTIYTYFKKLQKEGFIKSKKYNNEKKGRPSRIFSISKKIKNLIKKI